MREFLHTWKIYFVFAAVLSCLINILQLTFPFYMFTIYQNILMSYSREALYTITFAALYALLVFGIFTFIRSRLLQRAGTDLNENLRDSLFTSMLHAYSGPLKRGYRQGLGDLDTLRNYFANNGLYSLFDAPWAPLYLVLIYFFHPLLGTVATIGAVIMFGLSILQELLIRNRMSRANTNNQANQRFIDTVLRNAESVNCMGMLEGVAARWGRTNSLVLGDQTQASRHAGLIQSLIKPLQIVLQVLIYAFGAYLAIMQGLSPGLMIAGAIIMGRALAPLMQVMGTWKMTLQAKEAYKRLDAFCTAQEKRARKMPLPAPKGGVQAEQAAFAVNRHVLLHNISFRLQAGEFMGVIGASGAGKSTLCRLLTGIWPCASGKIRLDGVDMFYWDQDFLGRYIGYLPQEIELFPVSLAKNIARMGAVDRQLVEKAAAAAGIHELITELPNGYDTVVGGDDGVVLSGGQKQRVGLARALYSDPTLLVLDEPNSNLDQAGEQELMRTLSRIKESRACTCVLVTHKPDILQAADKILVLRQGQVAMFGPKNEVFHKLAHQTESPAVGKQ
jgi:PrtD family type I secretion system ABC transporter